MICSLYTTLPQVFDVINVLKFCVLKSFATFIRREESDVTFQSCPTLWQSWDKLHVLHGISEFRCSFILCSLAVSLVMIFQGPILIEKNLETILVVLGKIMCSTRQKFAQNRLCLTYFASLNPKRLSRRESRREILRFSIHVGVALI